MKRNKRGCPCQRKTQIFETAMDIAEKLGYQNLTRINLVAFTRFTPPTITHYWNLEELKIKVMQTAIKRKNLPIIAQGLLLQNAQALKMPAELKIKAQQYLEKQLKDDQ